MALSTNALHTLAVSCQAKKQHYVVSTFVSTFEILLGFAEYAVGLARLLTVFRHQQL
jgi:hypothetical protein